MAPFDFNNTLGAYELGVLVSYVLLGVTTSQTYVYYSRFASDTRRLKYLRLILIPRSLATAVAFSGIVGACGTPIPLIHEFYIHLSAVQAFFAGRIYRASNSLYIPCLSWGLSFFRLVGSIIAWVDGLPMETIPEFETRLVWLINSLWSVASANDVLIARTLVYWLHRQRPGADGRTVAVVDKLIAWTMETGAVTSASGLVSLACFVTMKTNFIWIAFFVVNARLYSNSFLASLNSRTGLRAIANTTETHDLGFKSAIGFKSAGFKSSSFYDPTITTQRSEP
ncbi:hypothetical protein B0H19DRAFT_128259 [Mycena capillaripes]|nr:hypothetical protein B0H19DRAFT_128259 [Mycena capillaripes]